MDADYKTPIDEIEKLLPWLDEGSHIVIGSRALSDSKIEVAQPLHRRFGSKAFGLAMHLATGLWAIHFKEVAVRWRDDGDSRLDLVVGNWQNMIDILRIRLASRAEAAELARRSRRLD